jgi:dTMP kinase
MKGLFITFEGGEGCGKSTQLRLLADALREAGRLVRVVREPGGTRVGEGIRDLLLDPRSAGMDPIAELMLYEAARAQVVSEVIVPALAAGEIVLCDRFFDSTTAYQGHARGLDLVMIRALNVIASGGLVPDRTLLLDLDPAVGLARATEGGADRLESEQTAFHAAVRRGFLTIAAEEPDRVRVVDASGTPEQVGLSVADSLADLLGAGEGSL